MRHLSSSASESTSPQTINHPELSPGATRTLVFLAVFLAGSLLSWSAQLLFRGSGLAEYFIDGAGFSDLYTPMSKTTDNAYFAPHYSNYPPLINLLYTIAKRLLPQTTWTQGWPSPEDSLGGQLTLILFIIVSAVGAYSLVKNRLSDSQADVPSGLIACCMVLSGPMLYAIARGNVVTIALLLSGVFVFGHQSDRRLTRELSYLCLALAGAIKIYPLVFGALLLERRDWQGVAKTALYTAVLMLLPFAVYGGVPAAIAFLQNLFMRNGSYFLSHAVGFRGSLQILLGGITGDLVTIPPIALPLAILALIALFFLSRRLWVKTFALCMALIWIPNGSYLYNIAFLILPLTLFLEECDIPADRWGDKLRSALFGLMLTPWFLPGMSAFNESVAADGMGSVSWGMFVVNAAAIFLVASVAVSVVMELHPEGPQESL